MSHWGEMAACAITEMSRAIHKAHPPISPENTCWLDSDCTHSYCWDCAVKARADEFGLGMPIGKADRYSLSWRTDLEEAFYAGIDGLPDVHSDIPESCHSCGETLNHILTDYGVENEIDYFLKFPLTELTPESSYAIDRLSLNIWKGTDRKALIAVFSILKTAVRLIAKQVPA